MFRSPGSVKCVSRFTGRTIEQIPLSTSKSLLLFGLGWGPSLGWQIEVPAPRPAPTEPITLDTLQALQPWR